MNCGERRDESNWGSLPPFQVDSSVARRYWEVGGGCSGSWMQENASRKSVNRLRTRFTKEGISGPTFRSAGAGSSYYEDEIRPLLARAAEFLAASKNLARAPNPFCSFSFSPSSKKMVCLSAPGFLLAVPESLLRPSPSHSFV